MLTYIPRPNEWEKHTQEGVGQRRGSNMAVIDKTLADYWITIDEAQGIALQADAALLLVKACNSWLKRKVGKSNKKYFGLRDRSLFIKRKQLITELGNVAIGKFNDFVGITPLSPEQRALGRYEGRRYATFVGTGPATPTKQLDPSYGPERELWLQSGKTKNVGGSLVHPTHGELASGEHSKEVLTDPIVAQIARKNVGNLTGSDWVTIKNFCVEHGIGGNHDDNSAQCRYLKKSERLAALIYFNGNGLLEDYKGQLISMWVGGATPPIYVMDRYGNLYTDSSPDIKWGGKFINHSSILSGNDVVCAGNMDIQNGELLLVNNNSGHYKPSRENLAECVTMLVAAGGDLSKTVVVLKVFLATGTFDWTWNDYTDFLANADPDSVNQRH